MKLNSDKIGRLFYFYCIACGERVLKGTNRKNNCRYIKLKVTTWKFNERLKYLVKNCYANFPHKKKMKSVILEKMISCFSVSLSMMFNILIFNALC